MAAYRLLYVSVRKQGRARAMTKCGLIISMCFVLTCGYALFDGPEMTAEQRPVPALVVGSELLTADAAV
jgi:hypothetical protein